MAKYSIFEPAEFTGDWQWPINAGESPTIAGTLTWRDRAALQLHDSFRPLQGAIYDDETHSYDTIHGVTTAAQRVTLLAASRSGMSWNFGQAGIRQPEKLVSSWVVVGAHVTPETGYTEIRVRIPGLQIWLSRSGIQQTIVQKATGNASSVIYEIEALPEEFTQIPILPATLGWGIDRKFAGGRGDDISIRTSACLRIRSVGPQPLEWFFQQLTKATALLSFVAGSAMATDQVVAKVAEDGADVEVLVALRESTPCTLKNGAEFFMLQGSMDVELGELFARWFELYDGIAMPCQLALSVLSSDDLWLHVEFLSLMQALEGFHRATTPGLYMPQEDYAPVKDALCSAIPEQVSQDHRKSLKSRIQYGNEISLRKRLDGLVSRLELPLRQQILGGSGTIPKGWVDTRNYYTHWDEASRRGVLNGADMHRAGVRMRILLRVLYLDLAGIPQVAIAKSLGNACRDSQYLVQLNSREYRDRNPESQAGMIMKIETKDAEAP